MSMNPEVSHFLSEQNHPLIDLINQLRGVILNTGCGLEENIKWNGPNFHLANEDRITMKIFPPKQIQLIFHRGAKKQTQPDQKLISEHSALLQWKENDRAILSLKTVEDLSKHQSEIQQIVKDWIKATS